VTTLTNSDPFGVSQLTSKVAAVEAKVTDLLNQDISSPVLRTIAERWRVNDIKEFKKTFTEEFARMRGVLSSATSSPTTSGDAKIYVD